MSLAIKRAGKFVDLNHIQEKVSRDAGKKFSETEIGQLVDSMVEKGLVEERTKEYAITEQGRGYFEKRWPKIEEELNRDYLKVYRAKRYYPHVVGTLLEFCRDRWVSVFRLFTGRAWLQRKLGPRYITIKSAKDVEKWLDVHGIDFVPYIHRIESDRPDWLVIDLDAGEGVSLEETKKVVRATDEVLLGHGVRASLKFSGSRGFQLWAQFKQHQIPGDYRPKRLRSERRERNAFSFYSDIVRFVESRVAEKLPSLTTSETAKKEARSGKVLLDASIIKPMGDVRAPYSMHYKTGLISVPLSIKELEKFEPEHGDPEAVVKRYEERGNEFALVLSDGGEIFKETTKWCEGG